MLHCIPAFFLGGEEGRGWGGGGGGGTLLTATRLDVLTGRKKLSTGFLALYLSCEGKGANRC